MEEMTSSSQFFHVPGGEGTSLKDSVAVCGLIQSTVA